MGKVQCNPWCLFVGATGALVASLAELTAKGEVSTLLRVRDALHTHLGLSVQPIYIVLLFVFLGAVLTLVSEVDDLKKAFYVGGSIITVFLTIIPNDLPPSIGGQASTQGGGISGSSWFAVNEAMAREPWEQGPTGEVRMRLLAPEGKEVGNVVLTVRDQQNGQIVGRSRYDSSHILFRLRSGNYLLVIEVPGFGVESREVEVRAGQPLELAVDLVPSWRPLPMQRLLRDY
ncbi:carboxypeptidase-like regulatory domain-containing protein [Thiovibrio sp. JS02]